MLATHTPVTFDKENVSASLTGRKQVQKPVSGLTRQRSFGVEVKNNQVTENVLSSSKSKPTLKKARSALGDITNNNSNNNASKNAKPIVPKTGNTKTAVTSKPAKTATHQEVELDWAYFPHPEKPYEDPFIERVDLPAIARLPAVTFDFGPPAEVPVLDDFKAEYEETPEVPYQPVDEEPALDNIGLPAPIEVMLDFDL